MAALGNVGTEVKPRPAVFALSLPSVGQGDMDITREAYTYSGGGGGSTIPAYAIFIKPDGTLGYGGELPLGSAWYAVPA